MGVGDEETTAVGIDAGRKVESLENPAGAHRGAGIKPIEDQKGMAGGVGDKEGLRVGVVRETRDHAGQVERGAGPRPCLPG